MGALLRRGFSRGIESAAETLHEDLVARLPDESWNGEATPTGRQKRRDNDPGVEVHKGPVKERRG